MLIELVNNNYFIHWNYHGVYIDKLKDLFTWDIWGEYLLGSENKKKNDEEDDI